jgi:hypothetical protein
MEGTHLNDAPYQLLYDYGVSPSLNIEPAYCIVTIH